MDRCFPAWITVVVAIGLGLLVGLVAIIPTPTIYAAYLNTSPLQTNPLQTSRLQPAFLPSSQSRLDVSPITGATDIVIGDDVWPLAISAPTLTTPANGATVTNTHRPMFDWLDVSGAVSYTLQITGEYNFTLSAQAASVEITTSVSSYTPAQNLPNSVYTWTVQAHNGGQVSGYAAPYTFTLQTPWRAFLPFVQKSPACPATSGAGFGVIPIEGGPARDHLPHLHGYLNLSLRGYSVTNAPKSLVDYAGSPDASAPQLDGLFNPDNYPGISAVYRVNSWDWGGGDGYPGGPITDWPVTMLGLPTTFGQAIYIPERVPEIYGGGYKAMVLYAEEKRITIVYTRRDTVADGYTVHIENVCVDPNLLAGYRAQLDGQGWHTNNLPALRSNQALGTAFGSEIQVVIRDKGSFMDPRSRLDWWKAY